MAKNTEKKSKSTQGGGKTIFGYLEGIFRLEQLFERGVPLRFVPYILFTTLLILLYIANSYYSEKMIRETAKLKNTVEDLRANYTTTKAEYMFISKQSEVSERVKDMGLIESKNPPKKIIVKKSEFN